MKETYEYIITDITEDNNNVKCRVEYNTENDYDTNYYFFDGNDWQKDFIDLNKLSPEDKDAQNKFEDFVTKVHDFMVHGNLWEQLKAMEDKEEITKKQYDLKITSTKI